MDAKAFHIKLERTAGLHSVVSALEGQGFAPLLKTARRELVQKLESLGFSAPPGILGREEMEVLLAPDEAGLVALRSDSASRPLMILAGSDLDVLLLSEDLDQLTRRIEAADYHVLPGSVAEQLAVGRLATDLGELSPNGKKLADPSYRAAARALYDDELRESVAAVSAAFGSLSLPEASLLEVEPFAGNPERLDRLLAVEGALLRNYCIRCSACERRLLDFQREEDAASSLANSGGKCADCGKAKLEVTPTFALTDALNGAIQQGLWLESLASDVAQEHTDPVWTGQMVGSKEIDVLAVVADKIVQIECKDTSFGQTDLAVIALKASQIRPDLIVVISTRDIHHNVKEDIDKIGRETNVISEPSAPAIQSQLSDLLRNLKEEYFANWFVVSGANTLGDQWWNSYFK